MILQDLVTTLGLIAGAAAWGRRGQHRIGPWDVAKTWFEGRTLIALEHGQTRPEPVVYLLAGLPGSAKTTYAKALENHGIVRLSVDERMTERHGRLGDDYPVADHLARLGPVIDEFRPDLINLIRVGRWVVLDHGLSRRADRDSYKRLVVNHGGTWRLVHFPVARAELLRRFTIRDAGTGTDVITPETLDWIAEHSEEPDGEGEEIVHWL